MTPGFGTGSGIGDRRGVGPKLTTVPSVGTTDGRRQGDNHVTTPKSLSLEGVGSNWRRGPERPGPGSGSTRRRGLVSTSFTNNDDTVAPKHDRQVYFSQKNREKPRVPPPRRRQPVSGPPTRYHRLFGTRVVPHSWLSILFGWGRIGETYASSVLSV